MIITPTTAALFFIMIIFFVLFAYFIGKLKSEIDYLKEQMNNSNKHVDSIISDKILNIKIQIAELKKDMQYYSKLKSKK